MRSNLHRGLAGRAGVIGALALAVAVPAADAAIVELGACASVASSDGARRYRLAGDVECASAGRAVLTIADGGMLELRSYTLRDVDVRCLGSCRVVGPGAIENGGVTGAGRVVVRRVAVNGSPTNGVRVTGGNRGKVTVLDSAITGSAGNGIEFDRRATILRSAVTGNARHGVAVSQEAGNDCARGRVTARASTFADNGREGDCGAAEVCADVATCTAREAKLASSRCGHSRQLGSGMPGSSCGVCELD